MTDWTSHDKEVEKIYKQVMVESNNKKNEQQTPDGTIFLRTVSKRIQQLLMSVQAIEQSPTFSKQQVDMVKQDFSRALTQILMHSNPAVIVKMTDKIIAAKAREEYVKNLK